MPPAIMIIEDDALIQELWHRLLSPQDYTLISCATPAVARQTLTQYIPDLIILDYLFEDAPLGQFFLRSLLAARQTQHIPVMIHSGVADLVASDATYFKEHDIHYLTKPSSTELMMEAVAQALPRVT